MEYKATFDNYLKENLTIAKDVVKKDWDMVFIIDGVEGGGKSVLAQQCAKYCDPDFSIERICFKPGEFRKAILTAGKYQAIVYDEAYTGLSSRAAMSLINKTLVSLLAEIRQKNLFVFIVMPCFFDLDKYAALWRSRALLHVYVGENWSRGLFAFYNSQKKKELYMLGKKFYSYKKPTPNFYGRFYNHYTVDEAEYRKKKKESLSKGNDLITPINVDEELFKRLVAVGDVISNKVKIDILGISEVTFYRKVKKLNEMKEFSKE